VAFALAFVLGCGWGAQDVGRAARRWAAGTGALEWRSSAGWQPITRDQAQRREWAPEHAFLAVGWSPTAPGLEVAELALRRPPNPLELTVVLARVDPVRWRFRVWGRASFAPGAVSELAMEAGLTLAINASYFAAEGPLGLVVSDGVARGRQGRNRAAHFVVPRGGAPRVINEKQAVLPPLEQGFQGFPAVMTEGRTYAYMRHGGRGFDVDAVERRSAGCILRDGRVLLLATDTLTSGLSLDELATVLGGLGCDDAMAFDGGSSTGLWSTAGDGRQIPNLKPVPVILGIEPR
jgi:hypothetical protein